MKPQFSRRSRSRQVSKSQDADFFAKEQRADFFGPAGASGFFSTQSPSESTVRRKCEKCEEEDKNGDKHVMKKDAGDGAATSTSTTLTGADGSGGVPLPRAAAAYFSEAIGADLNQVRIHTGTEADRSAKSIRAKAYTIGHHIVFRNGQYDTESKAGRWLLAHELAHVAQQNRGVLQRAAEPGTEEQPATVSNSGAGPVVYENQRDYANCTGVSVQGHTDANYTHSYSFSSAGQHSRGCEGCGDADCVTNTGTIVSVFGANPSVTLPSVPGGLSECETAAVQTFIDTTLNAHEQRHVAAFNTFIGTVRTPYTYTGCQSGEEAFVAARHEAIKDARMQASNAASALLDPFNEPIPCNCPDAAPEADSEQSAE